jgi:hypothetical protein
MAPDRNLAHASPPDLDVEETAGVVEGTAVDDERRSISEWLVGLDATDDPAMTRWQAAVPRNPVQRRTTEPPRARAASPVAAAAATPASPVAGAGQPRRTAAPRPPLPVYLPPEPPEARPQGHRVVVRGVTALVVGGAVLILGQALYSYMATDRGAAQAAELGEVVVSSHPSGAVVLFDGAKLGTTPLALRLPNGRRRLEVAGPDGTIQPLDTDVIAGQSVSRHVELLASASVAGDGVLIVETGDAAALLSVDGRPAGATALASTRVTPGPHVVHVRYRGGAVVERQILVPAGETVSLVLEPPRSRPSPAPALPTGPAQGWVRINAAFPVEVLERDQQVGSSGAGRIALEPGPHALELVNEALAFRTRVAAHVTAGKVAEVTVDTPRMPVAINAQPWAQVIVDGRALGDTPVANLMLPIGDHRVVLRHPDLGEREQTVTVRAVGATRVAVDLRR